MLKRLLMLAALMVALTLVACGGGPAGGPGGGPESGSEGGDSSELAKELSVYNWADYIDEQVLVDYE